MLDAALERCHAVHGVQDARGLHVHAVSGAGAGAVQLPVLPQQQPAAPAVAPAVAAPPSQPNVLPPENDEPLLALQSHQLSFEVSRHLGRLHVFWQNGDGLEHLGSVAPAHLGQAIDRAAFPLTLPAVRSAATAFWGSWSDLKTSDRTALLDAGKPLRVPCYSALAAAREAARSGPSTIRRAKRVDVIPGPPAGSRGQKFVFLPRPGGTRLTYPLYIGADGTWLCYSCSTNPARVQHPHSDKEPLVATLLDISCSNQCLSRCVRCAVARALHHLTRRSIACGRRPSLVTCAPSCISESAAFARSAPSTATSSPSACSCAAEAPGCRWRSSARCSWRASRASGMSRRC